MTTVRDAEARREAARAAGLNGIDYLEVDPSQLQLDVHLLSAAPGFDVTNVRIEGGERIRDFEVVAVAVSPTDPALRIVTLDRYGDFSPYRLRLSRSASDATPLVGFDPRLSEIEFEFKVSCPSKFDCRHDCECASEPVPDIAIDYLAKDYVSFRRLLIDRLAQLVPDWRDRSAADLGVTLAELLAYVGDHLSYWQDAVATEAYLDTARLRTSLRRHALLVDYRTHDGCNARTWMFLELEKGAGVAAVARGSAQFLTRVPELPDRITPGGAAATAALGSGAVIFEPMEDTMLYEEHNQIPIYAWGESSGCLPVGATAVTLEGHHPHLAPGSLLLFEETMGPQSGEPGDADPSHRQVVRLTTVDYADPDDATRPLTDPVTTPPTPITEVAWSTIDALTFPLCFASKTDADHGARPLTGISVARGNLVLADHGRTLDTGSAEALAPVPGSSVRAPAAPAADACAGAPLVPLPPRYRPRLARGPLTIEGTEPPPDDGSRPRAFDPTAPAVAALAWSLADARPARIELRADPDEPGAVWLPQRDLLGSGEDDRHFVVEIEHDGTTFLRFGDGRHGRRPAPGTAFSASYRIGNGAAGNVGADTLVQVVSAAPIAAVRNPLHATGGVDLETAASVRRHAPVAFRRQERAVTPADYAEVTERHAGIQRAAATLRWTGSWHTAFITVDRTSGLQLDEAFTSELARDVDRYRMAGHDLEFRDPVFVALELELQVCVKDDYFRSDVAREILQRLGSGTLLDGGLGLFHPDRLTFGQTIYLSPILTAARRVAGVASVTATTFQRLAAPDPQPLAQMLLPLARLEIARLDNDPSYPEHGVLRLQLFGGK